MRNFVLFVLIFFTSICLADSSQGRLSIKNDAIYFNDIQISPSNNEENVFKALGEPSRVDQQFYYWDRLGIRLDHNFSWLEVYFGPKVLLSITHPETPMEYFSGELTINGKIVTNDNFPRSVESVIDAPLNSTARNKKRGQYWFVSCPNGFRIHFSAYGKEGELSTLSSSVMGVRPCECEGYQIQTRFRTDDCPNEFIESIKEKTKSLSEIFL